MIWQQIREAFAECDDASATAAGDDASSRTLNVFWTMPPPSPSLSSASSSLKNLPYDDKPWSPNASYDVFQQCAPCPNPSSNLLIKVLRWVKFLVLRYARSYQHWIVFCAPLVLGIGIGIALSQLQRYVAIQRQQKWRTYTRDHGGTGSGPTPKSKLWILLVSVCWRVLEPFLALTQLLRKPITRSEVDHYDTHQAVGSSSWRRHDPTLPDRERQTRADLHSTRDQTCASGLARSQLPRHVAVIMDGNRRYGRQQFPHDPARGHWEGCRVVLELAKWCLSEHIEFVTIYAFSTENWHRDPREVAVLMDIFAHYCQELRVEAVKHNICVHVLSTDVAPIPSHVRRGLQALQDDTAHCHGLHLNICMSYGSRGEMVQVCRLLAHECVQGQLQAEHICETDVQARLLTAGCPDPDMLIRTSGEHRVSNFLCYQLAYAEFFFVDALWPAWTKADFIQVLHEYAARQRRYGK